MALSKTTDTRHPVERMAAAAAETTPTATKAVTGSAPAGSVPQRHGQVVSLPDRPQLAAPVGSAPAGRALDRQAVDPRPVAVPSPPTVVEGSEGVGPKRGGGVPRAQAAQVAAQGVTRPRQTLVTSRGKQDAVFRWPKADVMVVQRAHKEHAGAYRVHHRVSTDPSGVFRLSLSPFTATALSRALACVDEWVDTVRNDGRKTPVAGGTQQVGLKWPVALCEELHEVWERLDLERSVDGFTLTKANLAIAGILHEVGRVGQWVLDVPNDDRFSEPTALDGRLGPRSRTVLPSVTDA